MERSPASLIDELIADGIVTKPKDAVVEYFKAKRFMDKIAYMVESYNEDIHFCWTDYRDQAVKRLDMMFGKEWRLMDETQGQGASAT